MLDVGGGKPMTRVRALSAAFLVLIVSALSLGQSSSATVSGTVSDTAQALMPGVTISASNRDTGVVTTVISNESGSYNITGLLPGVYNVTAELPGFQTQTFTDVRLGNAVQARLNFTLQVASINTTVEVTVSADRLLIESTSSVGAVLPERTVQDLPIVGVMGNDAMSLVRTLPGLNLANNVITNADDSKLAGITASNVVVQRDGVDASAAGRWAAGLQPATIVNPDLVGEIRMVLAPVDAEIGRGNSQVQIQTRSGTNRFRGVAVWNIRNSALDPNTWANNRVKPTPTARNWENINEYTVSVGGPIVKNRTFFFGLWDGLLPASRNNVNATILTPCAQRGVFRYFDQWFNGNALQTKDPSTPRIAVVDFQGNPKLPDSSPTGGPYTGTLRYASVFGPLLNTPTTPDCSDAFVDTTRPWDADRRQMDPSGYVAKVLGVIPSPNNYEIGDGLNTAGHRWVRSARGSQNRFGFGFTDVRKQLNLKIDHNFSTKHKISGTWTYERVHADYAGGPWPYHFDGIARRRPQVLTVNFVSTLSPSLVNEVRWGMRRTGTNTIHGLANNQEARDFIPNYQGVPMLPQLGLDVTNVSLTATLLPQYICFCGGQPNFQTESGTLFNGNIAEKTPLYTYADTISWTKGKHAFKGGVEARFSNSELKDDVENTTFSSFARAFGGETQYRPIQGINSTNMPGLAGTATTGNVRLMKSLLSLLSGSIAEVHQMYWLGSADRLNEFDDYRDDVQRTRKLNQREVSAFFKDDWKISRDWTLNLGLRWDYYGVPWVSDGLTVLPAGGGDALFGYSGRSFKDWMRTGKNGEDTVLTFVGPDSPNPGQSAWPKDYNNFGPAIGFAWQVPWFGAGQTTVRGGYQISYQVGGGRFAALNGPLANPPGSSYDAVFNGATGLEYLDLTRMASLVPVPVSTKPMQPIPVTDRLTSLTAIDSHYTTPYIQNLTLAVTRNIGRNLTLDTRYIGTLGRKLYDSININVPNFLHNGLKEAFDTARSGGESTLLDDMFRGINVAGTGCATPQGTAVTCATVGSTNTQGVMQTGAMHLRALASGNARSNLANGNYQALATTLNTLNYSKTNAGNGSLPDIAANENGAVLRYNKFPENFIKTNPQFNNAFLLNNSGNTNYHSLQIQATERLAAGFSFQASYTWSKLLGRGGSPTGGNNPAYTDPTDRGGDYTLQTGDRRHDFRTNGTFELPIGPGQLLFRNSSGVWARIIEGWKMSWIVNVASGAPGNIVAQNNLYANGVPDRVGDFDPANGDVQWANGADNGNYFGGAYKKVADPQCGRVAASLSSFCTLRAIADSSNVIVLQNPLPGTRGNLGQNVIEMPGTWTFDSGLAKSFKIGESRRLHVRMDATNIFNHPQPANPTLDINSQTIEFGNINNKTGNRAFQAQMRLEF
jgi:hypothetical protein